LGFFVAVGLAMRSWHKQTAASMRMAAADSIDRVVSETNAIILQIQLFAEALAREVSRVHTGEVALQAARVLSPLADDVTVFRSNRQRLLQLEQEILALPSRYATLFLPLSGAAPSLDAIAEHVGTVAKVLWVSAPAGGTAHPDHRRILVETVAPAEYEQLAQICDTAHDAIAGLHAWLRTALLSPVLELNAMAFLRMARTLFRKADD
jgi:hypothetical protein